MRAKAGKWKRKGQGKGQGQGKGKGQEREREWDRERESTNAWTRVKNPRTILYCTGKSGIVCTVVNNP